MTPGTTRRYARARILGVATLLVAILGGCAFLDTKQRELIFRPAKEDVSWGIRSEAVQEVWLPVRGLDTARTQGDVDGGADRGVDDSEKIHAWWWPADQADAPTMLYLHGARWNLTGNAFRIARLRKMGFNVLAIDYRGFGRSSGTLPSERDAYEDAVTAWEYLKSRERDPAKRFVFGHSLGGAVAVELALRSPEMAGLILESTFTNMRDMASHMWVPMRYLPVGLVLTQHFDTLAKIDRVTVPILMVHGRADRWVPPEMSERLFGVATARKRLLMVDDASHSNVSAVGYDSYFSAISEFFGIPGERAPYR